MTDVDWHDWHTAYTDPASGLSRRLAAVQARVEEWLDEAPPGPLRVLAMCAGQGRDLLEPLAGHARRADVRAVLVELDPRNAAAASAGARRAGLDGVVVREADGSVASAYDGVVPVHLALVCGVLGNMTDDDAHRLVGLLPTLVGTGGTVVWTRHTGHPDLTPAVRRWFAEAGFRERSFVTPDPSTGQRWSVGVHVLAAPSGPYDKDARLFVFRGARTPDETVRHLG